MRKPPEVLHTGILNLMPKEIRGKLFTPNVHMDAIYIRSLFSASDRALIGSQPSRQCATGRLTRQADGRRCPAAESSVAFQRIACPSVPKLMPLPLCRRLPCVTGERVDGVSSVTKRKRSVSPTPYSFLCQAFTRIACAVGYKSKPSL